MENPFESGHIKNYVLLYGSVVVIMVLFFMASTLFHDVEVVQKKEFSTEIAEKEDSKNLEKENPASKFKLLEKAY